MLSLSEQELVDCVKYYGGGGGCKGGWMSDAFTYVKGNTKRQGLHTDS